MGLLLNRPLRFPLWPPPDADRLVSASDLASYGKIITAVAKKHFNLPGEWVTNAPARRSGVNAAHFLLLASRRAETIWLALPHRCRR